MKNPSRAFISSVHWCEVIYFDFLNWDIVKWPNTRYWRQCKYCGLCFQELWNVKTFGSIDMKLGTSPADSREMRGERKQIWKIMIDGHYYSVTNWKRRNECNKIVVAFIIIWVECERSVWQQKREKELIETICSSAMTRGRVAGTELIIENLYVIADEKLNSVYRFISIISLGWNDRNLISEFGHGKCTKKVAKLTAGTAHNFTSTACFHSIKYRKQIKKLLLHFA